MNEIKMLMSEIKLIKQSIVAMEKSSMSIGGWLPKKTVMRFFDYGDSQMRALELSKKLEVTKVGRRKFYSIKSIEDFMVNNMQK
jgi:hypothetical protein